MRSSSAEAVLEGGGEGISWQLSRMLAKAELGHLLSAQFPQSFVEEL